MTDRRKRILLAGLPLVGHAVPLLRLGVKLSRFHQVTITVFESMLPFLEQELQRIETNDNRISLLNVKWVTDICSATENVQFKKHCHKSVWGYNYYHAATPPIIVNECVDGWRGGRRAGPIYPVKRSFAKVQAGSHHNRQLFRYDVL